MELNIESAHILPKGFYLSAMPGFVFNLNQDFNFFSLGAAVGPALTKNFAIGGGYVHYAAGRKKVQPGLHGRRGLQLGR